MTNYIYNDPNVVVTINAIPSNQAHDKSYADMTNEAINDLTKTTFGRPDPNKKVIGICNRGDGYIYEGDIYFN